MRRTIGIGLALLVSIVAASPGAAGTIHGTHPSTADEVDSVTFQSTISHDGHVVDPSITLPLSQRWTVPLSAPSYPLIAQGLVFVTTFASARPAHVIALDSTTGTRVWSHRTGGPWARDAYDNGDVFIVDRNGRLRAYDAATGTRLWHRQLPKQYDFDASPVASDGVVYVAGAGFGGTLYAVNESDGHILWRRLMGNGSTDSSPALSDTSVFVSYACPQTYAFARSTGTRLWHFSGPCIGGGGTTPALHDNRVYVRDSHIGHQDGLILGAKHGKNLGSFSGTLIPAFAGDMAFVVNDGVLSGESLTSLSTTWSFDDGHKDLSTPPLVVNGWVFVGSSSGRVYARRKATGNGAWHANVGAEILSDETSTALGAGDGLLVVPAADRLVAYGSA